MSHTHKHTHNFHLAKYRKPHTNQMPTINSFEYALPVRSREFILLWKRKHFTQMHAHTEPAHTRNYCCRCSDVCDKIRWLTLNSPRFQLFLFCFRCYSLLACLVVRLRMQKTINFFRMLRGEIERGFQIYSITKVVNLNGPKRQRVVR